MRGEQRSREVPGRGQWRRLETKNPGLLEVKPTPVEELVLRAPAMHRAQERERLCVGAEQDVLAVVDLSLRQIDPAGAAAEHARRLEEADAAPGGGKRHRCGHAGPAAADDRDSLGHPDLAPALNMSTMSSRRSTPCEAASARSCGRGPGSRRARSRRATP